MKLSNWPGCRRQGCFKAMEAQWTVYINNFAEGESQAGSGWAKFALTAEAGKVYQADHYNQDVIIFARHLK